MSADDATSDLAELRRAAINDPRDGALRYLLATELAQLEDFEGALLECSAATALDPSLDVGRFQLGLLQLTLMQQRQALAVLGALERLADTDPLKHFKRALEALIHNDQPVFVRSIQQGIELNSSNQVLDRDMQLLLNRVREQAATPPPHPLKPKCAATSRCTASPSTEPWIRCGRLRP